MVDTKSIKKKKKKKRIIIATSISSVVVAALIIVAFLSSYVGNFTISVVNWDSKIALATTPNPSKSDETTYLKALGFSNAAESTILRNDELSDATFDTDVGGDKSTVNSMNVSNGSAIGFYVYTFFVKNVGDNLIQYYYGFNLTSESSDSSGKKISDLLRIRVYENLYSSTKTPTHDYIDYTRENTGYIYDDLTGDMQTYLTNCKTEIDEGSLKYFSNTSNNIIASESSPYRLAPDEVIRYTFVMWIEGNDPDCDGDYPTAASLRLSAYVGSVEAEAN